jgi:hypothetical protein
MIGNKNKLVSFVFIMYMPWFTINSKASQNKDTTLILLQLAQIAAERTKNNGR